MDDLLTEQETAELGRRELNKLSKQRRILKAATELFTELGYEGTTTAGVADRAGIGTGTLYLYVGSKEELLVEVFLTKVEGIWEEAFDQRDLTAPLLDQLLSVFNHVARYHEAEANLSRAFFKEIRFMAPDMMGRADELVAGIVGRVTELLTQAQADGALDPELDSRDLSRILYYIWTALMARRHSGRTTWDGYVAQMERLFRTSFQGLAP